VTQHNETNDTPPMTIIEGAPTLQFVWCAAVSSPHISSAHTDTWCPPPPPPLGGASHQHAQPRFTSTMPNLFVHAGPHLSCLLSQECRQLVYVGVWRRAGLVICCGCRNCQPRAAAPLPPAATHTDRKRQCDSEARVINPSHSGPAVHTKRLQEQAMG
jgi:hypothetical protein